MLVLARSGDIYPDDVDGTRRHRLPLALAPVTTSDGRAQVALTRSTDGGSLQLKLGPVWPTLASNERGVVFASGRFRLILRTAGAGESGDWHEASLGESLVERSISLTPLEAAIARRVAERGLVDVEVELELRGNSPTFPWLASVPARTLRPRLEAVLGPAPASWELVERAMLGLSSDTFVWYSLEPRALPPPRDAALLALARHLRGSLFVPEAQGWLCADLGATRLDVSLQVPRQGSERVGYRWSFSDFLAAQPDPSRYILDVTTPPPFAAADITLVNDLPLANDGIRSIEVEVRTGGPSGVLRHEFRPGAASSARLRFVRESFEEPRIRWTTRTTLLTAAGPTIVESQARDSGQSIELSSASLNLVALRVSAEPEVFEHVSALEVRLGARTIRLTASAREAWVVGRVAPASAPVQAVLSSGERRALAELPVARGGVLIGLDALGVAADTTVVLEPPPQLGSRIVYLAVQVADRGWRTMDAGKALLVRTRRADHFTPPQLRYRTRSVGRGADGSTSVMKESVWRDTSGDTVAVVV